MSRIHAGMKPLRTRAEIEAPDPWIGVPRFEELKKQVTTLEPFTRKHSKDWGVPPSPAADGVLALTLARIRAVYRRA